MKRVQRHTSSNHHKLESSTHLYEIVAAPILEQHPPGAVGLTAATTSWGGQLAQHSSLCAHQALFVVVGDRQMLEQEEGRSQRSSYRD